MADVDISSMIEDSPIQSLGSVSEGLSIIERLLITSDCEGNSIFSRFIAIRYLGGILDLPPFWLQSGTMYRAIVQKLLTRATLLLKDLGLDSGPDDSMLGVPSDIEGVDILFEVILARIQTWVPNRSSSGITSEVWYPSLCHAVQLLRRPTMENILPRSWALVTGGKLRELVASEYEAGVVDIISATELFSDQVERLYEHWAPPPPRQKELELKERLKKRVLQYGTVTCTLLKDVSNASNQRYLPAIASVSLLIMETVQQLKDNEEICVEMVERSYEIVFAIINICRDPQEAPSPAIICNIIQFSETLEKILAFVRSQVKGGIWRSLIPSLADKVLLKACNAGLKRALDVFGVQPGIIMRIAEIQTLRSVTRSSWPSYTKEGPGPSAPGTAHRSHHRTSRRTSPLVRRCRTSAMTRPFLRGSAYIGVG
ncbi:hypothetical protein C8R44DRAFT_332749 [Mycena epipterygia]|nr:hypothetical protein C8R44DRAFT_332749 [Mycena epipterygia]